MDVLGIWIPEIFVNVWAKLGFFGKLGTIWLGFLFFIAGIGAVYFVWCCLIGILNFFFTQMENLWNSAVPEFLKTEKEKKDG